MTGLDRQNGQTGPDRQTVRTDRTRRLDEIDEMDELVKAVREAELRAGPSKLVIDKTEEEKEREYWARQIDPAQIKSKNWARHHKRSKKLWRTTRGRGRTGGGGDSAVVDSIRKALGGGQ